jgi:hypothetical protein
MNKPVFRVVGLDHATCDEAYFDEETSTDQGFAPATISQLSIFQPSEPETVTIRLCDMLPSLTAASARLAWVNDFADDPVVITKDLYEVLLTYQRSKNAA